MHAGWRILDLSRLEGRVRYIRGQLVVEPQEGPESVIPLAQIAAIFVGTRVGLSGAVLAKAAEYDVAINVVDWSGKPLVSAIGVHTHSRVGARQQAQAELSVPRKKQAWAAIVRAKIRHQIRVVEHLDLRPSVELLDCLRAVKSGDSTNREAVAARLYWSQLRGSVPFRRLPGTRSDGWNSALDYGYSIVRAYGMRGVTAAGLAGSLGVFHHGRSNAFGLVDDLMEPFRQIVDLFVFRNVEFDQELDREVKRAIVEALEVPFSGSGEVLRNVFVDFCQQYGRFVEGDVSKLVVPDWVAVI